ncbi:double-stranded RNA-binding protein 4-like isoform X2 [Phragmites australis]|uniref:double-stranded RNA-binding protein 4-like isoform X2 n=1 Tax=Phragmites australis TaxID=29695 RepID=UPI002D790A7D|nr:double-stranded RNA-binding protein 4-like isoform X2 [Phragmites australis]
MAATVTVKTPAAADTATPTPPPAIPDEYMHKNRLQAFAQRTRKKLPIYNVEVEGEYHQPKFRCTVDVGGELFSSTGNFNRRKKAEQDAARVAYEILVTSRKGDVKEVFALIDQDVVFCKSILHEFAVKTKSTWPSYSVVRLERPMTLFVASVVFDGNTYTGEAAATKKDAKQKAARAVIKSILATDNACMMDIIRSKKKLITAITSSGNNIDTGAVNQETHSTPTKTPTTFAPIKFTGPVEYTTYGGPDHVAPESQDKSSSLIAVQGYNIVPAVEPSANPSAKAVTSSNKRKGRVEEGPKVDEARVAQER